MGVVNGDMRPIFLHRLFVFMAADIQENGRAQVRAPTDGKCYVGIIPMSSVYIIRSMLVFVLGHASRWFKLIVFGMLLLFKHVAYVINFNLATTIK